ncbi:uncharacterized protein LOC131619693 [Vicia villosa]|uniref:uncharacterized protein LOC131619693 n=1 Tax=Vicia villosa TaxID=3911 RepID=UPI00273BB2C4|nr:uncharacterized protein LOC131619693 [Vicia villosa]
MEVEDVDIMKNDITLGLRKKHFLPYCPLCKTYRDTPKTPIKLQFQSKQHLDFCIKQLEKNLSAKKVRLLGSQVIPTQPDSNIIKISVTVQKEVLNGETLQQSYDVEFVQHNRICEPCTRVQPNPNQWNSVVQLKPQHCDMRSFFHLEWLILKHCAAVNDVRINKMKHGIDFFFPDRSGAIKFLDFVKGEVPVRISESKGFVSLVTKKSNCYSYRYNFSVEVCPIYRQDLVFLPPKVASCLGNIGPIVICTKVTNVITLFDPLTSTQCCLDGDVYWRAPFKSLLTRNELVEYAVLDVKEVCSEVTIDGKKFGLANAEVARVEDLGKNDTRFSIKTHLGYLLKTGDRALGYDLWEANCSDSEIELKEHIGDGVILMRKAYGLNRLMKRRVEHQSYLKDLEEITNEVLGMSLGGEETPLEERLGNLNLSGEEDKEKKKARRMA